MGYTSDDIVSRVQRIAAIPANAPGFEADTVLSIVNDELTSEVVPYLISLRGEWLLDKSDTLIDGSTEFFNIPAQAVGGLLRDVQIVNKDSDAMETDDIYYDLQRVDPGEAVQCNYPAFTMRGDRVQVVNVENYRNNYLRLTYWRRPNELTLITNARQVVTIGTGNVTVASVPTAWGSSPTLDVVQSTPQFRAKGEAVSTTVLGTTVTGTFPADIAVGDWLSLTGYAPVAQIPDICYPYLAQSAALKVLETYPDAGGLNAVGAKLKVIRERLDEIMKERIEGAPQSFGRNNSALDYV